MRRLRANAVGWRRGDEGGEVRAAERRAGSSARARAPWPSAGRRRAAGSRRAPRPGPACVTSTCAPPGRRQRDATRARRRSAASPRASSPSRQRTSPAASSRRRRTLASSSSSAAARRRGAGPWPGTRDRPQRRRSRRRQTSRSSVSKSSPPAVGSAVIIEYSGTSSQVDVSTRQRLRGDQQRARRVGGGHRRLPVAHDVLAADRVPEAHVRQVGLEQRVVVGVPAVVEREPRGDERVARREEEVHRRRGVDPVAAAHLAQDPQRGDGGVGELARSRARRTDPRAARARARRSTRSPSSPRSAARARAGRGG